MMKDVLAYSLVTIFAKLDVGIDSQRHKENQNRVK